MVPELTSPRAVRILGCVALTILAVAGSALTASPADGDPPADTIAVPGPVITARPGPAASTFSLAELAAGNVDAEVYDAFWSGQRDLLLRAPCRPGSGTAGATRVTVFVGADAAWEERLAEAVAQRQRECQQGAEATTR